MPTVTVYADLLFLINAGMDGLCFALTARLLHRPLRVWQWLLGSTLGGVYAVMALLLPWEGMWVAISDLATGLLLCAIVFGGRGTGRRFPASAGLYFLTSALLGGVMTALYSLWTNAGLADHLPTGEDGAGAWLFLALALTGTLVTTKGGRLLSRTARTHTCTVTVELEGRRVSLCGLVDSGNLLREPISGRAVICADEKALAHLLSPTLKVLLSDPTALEDPTAATSDAHRLRLIPADTATGGGLLAGFVPDKITVFSVTDPAPSSAPPDAEAVTAIVALLPGNRPLPVGIDCLVPADLTAHLRGR